MNKPQRQSERGKKREREKREIECSYLQGCSPNFSNNHVWAKLKSVKNFIQVLRVGKTQVLDSVASSYSVQS